MTRMRATLWAVGAALTLAAAPALAQTPVQPPRVVVQPDPSAGLDRLFAAFTAATPGCAVGVDQAGQPVVRRAWGLAEMEHRIPATAATVYEAGSVSKQFTATAIVMLADLGRLSLDDDVRRYVPELPETDTPITIRMMLNHTSGLRDWGSVAEIEGWPRGTRTVDNGTVVEILARQRSLNYEPGAEYLYSNSGYNLSAVIVERVAGESLAEFTRKQIFVPLGMTHTRWRDDYSAIVPGRAVAYEPADGGGYHQAMPFENAYGNGGLLTTVGDLMIWNRALAEGRVAPNLLQRLIEPGLADGRPTHYGLGLQTDTAAGQPEISHSGATAGYRAWLARYPEQDLSVAVLCNTGEANSVQLGRGIAALYLPTPTRAEAVAEAATATPFDPAVVGLWSDARTGEPFGLSVGPDGALRTAGGDVVRVLGPNLYQLGNDRLEFVSADVFERLTNDGARRSYTRQAAVTPTVDELEDYVGVFVSDEAQARLTVEVRDGVLTLINRGYPMPLSASYADVFTGRQGLIRFTRDRRGRVDAMHVNNGRVRDMVLERGE